MEYSLTQVDNIIFLDKSFFVPVIEGLEKYRIEKVYLYESHTVCTQFNNITQYIHEIELTQSTVIEKIEFGENNIVLYRTKDYIIKRTILIENFKEEYKLQKQSIETSADNIKFIKNQTYDLCILAINKEPDSIKYIHNQTEELCIMAININLKCFIHIKNYNITE